MTDEKKKEETKPADQSKKPADQSKQATDQSKQATMSERFLAKVEQQFTAELGTVQPFTEYQRTLAQHLYIKIDYALKQSEVKRRLKDQNGNGTVPFIWQSINMEKLAIDAVHRVNLGLDALIDDHIYPIPYLNNRTKKYDLDLRIGYKGKHFLRTQYAVEPPKKIIYRLVHEHDLFQAIPQDKEHAVETYKFEITQPWDRGQVVGGFGYIIYEDETKNELILVSRAHMDQVRAGKPDEFWKEWTEEMQLKTVVNFVTARIPIDPRKVNGLSLAKVEAEEELPPDRRISKRGVIDAADFTAKPAKPATEELPEPNIDDPPAGDAQAPQGDPAQPNASTQAAAGDGAQTEIPGARPKRRARF